ncbi:YobI family P-loop NTPase [Porphyromonas sp.]
MKNQSLLPELIGKDSEAYPIVEDLKEALKTAFENRKIKNIALTGPYGSGKSSILDTLLTVLPKERAVLRISLATLRVDEASADYENASQSERNWDDTEEEVLNRKIEYSILQQLIYHEKACTLPNSRLRRILHIPPRKLCIYSFGVIAFLLSFFIAFEPSWARISTFYTLFNWGWGNIVFDIASTVYMLGAIWFLIGKVISFYSNTKLGKLNLTEASIELNEDTISIFNRYLDEILYFFEATEYDIVIIEDLDRFGTPKVFLKLRELNFLLNESKVIDRHIVFIYAVKDDMFKDEERTKFFDYISTVIPVINPSNSKSILKKALEERGVLHDDITDDDLSEMAFFIQDMRILKNIANEYAQYCSLLYRQNKHLDRAKLLAMIVYKNYHPQDFALLHRRQGKVYECLSKKPYFVKLALARNEEEKVKLETLKQVRQRDLYSWEIDLRVLLLDMVRNQLPETLCKVEVNGENYTLAEVAADSNLFDELTRHQSIRYTYWGNGYAGTSRAEKAIDIDALRQQMNYDSRLEAVQTTPQVILEMEQSILRHELEITGYTFKELFSLFDMQECKEYTEIDLAPMMDVFLRLGYLNEEYYDYISYFYEGMITQSDHALLLSIKRQITQSPSTPIDKIENFYRELKPHMFEHKSILNNHLVDYVAHNNNRESFERIMKTIEKEDTPLSFLAQYYQLGNEREKVFKHFIMWNKKESWRIIENHSDFEERELLREAWLRFADDITDVPQEWLDVNFQFIQSHHESLGIERCRALCIRSKFEEISLSNDDDLLDCIIEHSSYKINTRNLSVIVSYLTKQSVDDNTLNYSWCLDTNNQTFIGYINNHLKDCLDLFSSNGKREGARGILALLNREEITIEIKKMYLTEQENRLIDYNGLSEEVLELTTRLFLVEPTWDNVVWYFRKKEELTDELTSYIEHFKVELSEEIIAEAEDVQPIFESIVVSAQVSNDTLSQLLTIFRDNRLDGVDVTSLSEERLGLLLAKFPFTDANTAVLADTPIFADYLIINSNEMLPKISSDLFIDSSVSEKVLTSNKFSPSQKERILREIPESHLYASIEMANSVIEIICDSLLFPIERNTLIEIIRKSTLHDERLKLVTQMIQDASGDDKIAELLGLLGEAYAEISDRIKHPKLDRNTLNTALLNALKTKGFISSFREEKDGESWRVYPPRS